MPWITVANFFKATNSPCSWIKNLHQNGLMQVQVHRKTLAQLREAVSKYSFVVQDKSTTLLPPHLRLTSTKQVNLFGAHTLALREGQATDPDIRDCHFFMSNRVWPENCSPDRQQQLQALIPKLIQGPSKIVWIQTHEQTALFLPAKFRSALVCRNTLAPKDPKATLRAIFR